MFDMGFLELAVIAGIGLLVLGPERLPVAARTVGRYVGQARRFVGNFQRQIEQEVRLEELNKKIMRDTEGQSFTNNDGTVTNTQQSQQEKDATSAEGGADTASNTDTTQNNGGEQQPEASRNDRSSGQ